MYIWHVISLKNFSNLNFIEHYKQYMYIVYFKNNNYNKNKQIYDLVQSIYITETFSYLEFATE